MLFNQRENLILLQESFGASFTCRLFSRSYLFHKVAQSDPLEPKQFLNQKTQAIRLAFMFLLFLGMTNSFLD